MNLYFDKVLNRTVDVVETASNCWEQLMPGIPYSRIENCAKVNSTLLQYFRIKLTPSLNEDFGIKNEPK